MTLVDSATETLGGVNSAHLNTERLDVLTERIEVPTQYIPRYRKVSKPQPEGDSKGRTQLRHRLMVGAGIALVGLMHLVNVDGWPQFFDDEGTYVAQAWAVYHGQLAHYTYWYDHPPAGWLQLAAIMGLPDLLGISPTVAVARYIAVGYTMATAVLIYGVCRNLRLHRATSLAAMMIWGICPLVIYEGRQVMLDNLALPWLLGAFLLATARQRTLWQHLAAGALFGVAILTKETTILLAPALYFAVWNAAYRPTRAFSMAAVTVTSILGGATYLIFAALKNEIFSGPGHVSLQDAIKFQLVGRAGSGNVLQPTSIARGVLESWLAHDAVLLSAGVSAGVVCLFIRRLRPLAVALVVMVVVALRPNGYMPLMYVIVVLPFAALALAGTAEHLILVVSRVRWRGVPVASFPVVAMIAVLAIAVTPTWWQRDTVALTANANSPYSDALAYAKANLPRNTRILADDAYWNNLVNAGWNSNGWDGAIWYYKLDLDPLARDAHLPNGWRDINYLIVNSDVLSSLQGQTSLPELQQAYQHSITIKRWGSGDQAVEVRKITLISTAHTMETS